MSDRDPEIGSRVGAAMPDSGQHEVLVVGRRAPASATSTRLRHVKNLAGTRKYLWPAVFIGGGLFLLGSTTGNPLVALAPLLLVLIVLAVRLWREATRLAARDFFEGYALEHHLNYSARMMLLASTPLLGAGEKRRCEHFMEGELAGAGGAPLGIAHFVIETREDKHDRRNRPIAIFTPHDFTIAMVDLTRPAKSLPGIFLARKHGRLARHNWLDRKALLPATIEHERLASESELLVRPGFDRERLRALMRADLQKALADSTLSPGFEYDDGTLVVYAPHLLKRPEEIDGLIALAESIAERLLEVGEPLKAVDTTLSHGPPSGVAAFPSPPPATKPHVEPHLRVAPEPETERRAAPGYGRASVPPPGS